MTGDPTHPVIEVHGPEDLRAVAPIYARLVATAAPASLELRLAPGTYANTGLQLQDGARRGQVSVTVRCDGVAVFDRVPFTIDGDVVAVSGVVWRPGPRGVGATFTVRSRLELDRVAVIGAVGGGQIAGPALGVNAGYRTGDHTVVIRDAWFVGNRISGPAIAFGASLPDRFATLTLDRLTFADNQASALVEARGDGALAMTGWQVGQAGPVLRLGPATKATMRASTLGVETLEGVEATDVVFQPGFTVADAAARAERLQAPSGG